jgi:hypothetical protein
VPLYAASGSLVSSGALSTADSSVVCFDTSAGLELGVFFVSSGDFLQDKTDKLKINNIRMQIFRVELEVSYGIFTLP